MIWVFWRARSCFCHAIFAVSFVLVQGQTAYIPSGTGGIANNTSNGNVGIGIATPATLLELKTLTSGGSPTLRLSNDGTSTGEMSLELRRNDSDAAIVKLVPGGGGMRIGATHTSGRIRFYTSSNMDLTSNQRMVIDENGYVGVGTASPSYALHVSGKVYASSEVQGGSAVIRSGSSKAILGSNSTSVPVFLNLDASDARSDLVVATSGYVGVGTSSPLDKLSLSGSSNLGFGIFNTSWAVGNEASVRFRHGDGTGNGVGNGAQAEIRSYLPGDGDADLRFYTTDYTSMATTPVVVMTGNQNVGIGTTTPSNKLEVNGTIRTKEVIVESTGWPDYVFRESYKLKGLSEVESYIAANGHLPDVPSAADVAEKGVSLGEMQATLLRKIEELTLHMIQLDQTNRQLGEENRDLRADVDALKQKANH